MNRSSLLQVLKSDLPYDQKVMKVQEVTSFSPPKAAGIIDGYKDDKPDQSRWPGMGDMYSGGFQAGRALYLAETANIN